MVILSFASRQFCLVPHCCRTPAPHLPVAPEARNPFSKTTMSFMPFLARLKAAEHPIIPPPMMTISALDFISTTHDLFKGYPTEGGSVILFHDLVYILACNGSNFPCNQRGAGFSLAWPHATTCNAFDFFQRCISLMDQFSNPAKCHVFTTTDYDIVFSHLPHRLFT